MENNSILLVDDDVFSLEGTAQDLSSVGYEVTTAGNGEDAVSFLSERAFDLVITDLIMGEVDGIEVLKTAKKLHPLTMVIILTGYGDMSSAIEALRHSADDYLLKPCEPEETHYRVSRCLKKLELKTRLKAYEEILPICCQCKKIRDDAGREPGSGGWLNIEGYLEKRGKLAISTTLCPGCQTK